MPTCDFCKKDFVTKGSFLYRLFDMEDLDNETDDQFEYHRKMKDLFKQKKKQWKESTEKCIEFILDSYSNNYRLKC